MVQIMQVLIKYQMQFVYLRTSFVCGSNDFQHGSIFSRNAQKKRKKPNREKLNVDRQIFKDIICIF